MKVSRLRGRSRHLITGPNLHWSSRRKCSRTRRDQKASRLKEIDVRGSSEGVHDAMSILGRWREAAMTTYPGRFAGKTAMVTGAAQGIGRDVALRLAREGARVAEVGAVHEACCGSSAHATASTRSVGLFRFPVRLSRPAMALSGINRAQARISFIVSGSTDQRV
jgi:hypothetical protein